MPLPTIQPGFYVATPISAYQGGASIAVWNTGDPQPVNPPQYWWDHFPSDAELAAQGFAPKSPRPLYAIYNSLAALSSTQKTNIWTDLSSGSPAKYLADLGPNAAAIAALDWAVRFSGLGAAAITDAKLRIAAIYVADNPTYLLSPSFDPTINVPAWA